MKYAVSSILEFFNKNMSAETQFIREVVGFRVKFNCQSLRLLPWMVTCLVKDAAGNYLEEVEEHYIDIEQQVCRLDRRYSDSEINGLSAMPAGCFRFLEAMSVAERANDSNDLYHSEIVIGGAHVDTSPFACIWWFNHNVFDRMGFPVDEIFVSLVDARTGELTFQDMI